jgi:hypothetical protein
MGANKSEFTILIVDDDEGHVELVRRNLRRIALSNPILVLSDGSRALDYVFRRGDFAERVSEGPIIQLDINMPGGLSEMEVARCYELGCPDYITKRVDSLRFIEPIERLGFFLQIVRLATADAGAAKVSAP